jgi:hypothetical protein
MMAIPCHHRTCFLVATVLLLAIISSRRGDEGTKPISRRLREVDGEPQEEERDITDASSINLWMEKNSQSTDNSVSATATATVATLQYVPLFCIDSARCAKLDMNRRFSFVHISKTGGTSWILEFKTLLTNFFPQEDHGIEYSVSYQNSLDPFDFLSYHLVSLRSPRLHLWSLFTECKYDTWGKLMTNGTHFPRSGTTPAADVHDFRIWLNHFVDHADDDPTKTTTTPKRASNSYGCYFASNFQTNYLTSTAIRPLRRDDTKAVLEPDIERSIQVYESMDWVALTDFFHESKCLFYHRLEPKTAQIEAYLRDLCRCNSGSSSIGSSSSKQEVVKDDVHATHHANGHRSSILDLPTDVLQSVDALTRVDQQLYQMALERFVQEIVWLETELGRQVLCDNVLEKWEPELKYLGNGGMSISSIYKDQKSAFTNE